MYCFKSKRQVTYKPKQPDSSFRHRLEWPQPLSVGIAVHQSTRSKKFLEFLRGFGLSEDYTRILRLETQLANASNLTGTNGDAKAEALPGFHAFSGADVTGRSAGKGKLTCWQALSRCSMEVVSAFAALGTSEKLEVETERAICLPALRAW